MAETEIEGRFIEVKFGRLEISKERSKHVTFSRPFTDENISYVIKKNCSYKSIKPNFYLDHYEGVLKPHQDFKLVVTYRPTIASVKDIEVFDYSDSDNERIKITVTGVAVGPHCTFSVKRLDFYKMPNQKVIERKVEISNDSLATARFKMDLADHDIFQVQPLEGTLKPNSYQYLTVRFRPNKPGLFARKVFCLIWNSEPFVLDVLGRYSTQPEPIDLELRYFTTRQTFGFEAYMEDSLMTRKDVPPFSLTANYLDFGCVLIDGNQPRTRVISVTNHRTRPMVLDWNRGTETRIFKISPDLIKIPSNKSVLFEVEFNPDQNYNVFQESLTAQVDYTKEGDHSDNFTIPLTTFLKVQGHSFPQNEGWITHIEVLPDVVYWQPCAPGEKVSTTFLLRNRTHLPILYKLVPPKISNVTAKPMMGKFRNYEIVAVQLRAEALKIKTYIEEWQIIINGREDRPITVYFHGESCLPIVEIGTKNKIDAGSVQNGSLKTVETFMTNLSYYTIRYQFVLDDKSFITISPMWGTLPCNEVTKLSIQLMGNQCAPGKEIFVCEMRIIDGSGAIIGNSYDIEVEIVYETSFSQLCACPDVKDFGRITFGNRVKCEFQAVNFGESSIYFEMCQTGDENHDPNFRIKPYFGEIKPKMSRHFSIIGFVSKVGSQTLNFGYYNRRTKDSPLVTGEPLTLFTLSYISELPIIQVDEIVEHNFGELFSKKHFFEDYFQIPRLNQLLHDIQNDETLQFNMRLPDVEMQEKEFYLKLALTNVSDFDSTVNVKRKKICDCMMEEMSAGLSERKKGYNCPHRETLQIDLEENNFLAKSTRFLTIKVKYTLPNVTVMCYNIELTNHRTIELLFTICSILPDLPKISTYTPDFNYNLKDVYIGLQTAPVQMFWFYNNSHNLLNFHLDTEEIGRRCRLEGFKVWEILNPVDQILPYQSKALLVRFHSIEAKTYSLDVDLKFYHPSKKNPSLVKFKLQGSGVVNLEPQPSLKLPKVPKFISNFPASLSLELLEVKRMSVWSCRKELLFIKNNSRGKIVQYIWGSVNIENVIEISTDTKFNILQPKEIQPVIVTIKSLSLPCWATLQLPCEVVEYSDLVIHKITKETHEIAENRIDEFMEDKPVKNKRPANPVKVLPPPPTLYVYVTIDVTTLGAADFDLSVDKSIQIKQFPNQSMENIPKNLLKAYYPKDEVAKFPEKEKVFPVVKVNDGRVFCDVLEQVLSEVLFSNMLKQLLEQSSKAPMHFYNEFIMDDRKIMERKAQKTALSNEDIERYRKNEISNFFNQPKLPELSNILQNIICDSVFSMVQCSKVSDYDLSSLDEQIEKSLYTCRAKTCNNCKNLASNK